MDKPKFKMDPRCPKKLEHLPDSYCDLAVLKLKQIRNAGKELTEEEETKLSGCNFFCNHQQANYCFFKYASMYLDAGSPPSDLEIAHMCGVSVDTVKTIAKTAISKFEQSDMIKNIKRNRDGESVLSVQWSDEEEFPVNL